jgi:hypothetical protein
VFDDIEKGPLPYERSRQHMLNLIDDEYPDDDGREQAHHLVLELTRARR